MLRVRGVRASTHETRNDAVGVAAVNKASLFMDTAIAAGLLTSERSSRLQRCLRINRLIYRTLEEARTDIVELIERQLGQASNLNAGKMMKFAPLTPAIGR